MTAPVGPAETIPSAILSFNNLEHTFKELSLFFLTAIAGYSSCSIFCVAFITDNLRLSYSCFCNRLFIFPSSPTKMILKSLAFILLSFKYRIVPLIISSGA